MDRRAVPVEAFLLVMVVRTPCLWASPRRDFVQLESRILSGGCLQYSNWSDAGRSVFSKESLDCEGFPTSGWYRFVESAGERLLQACPVGVKGGNRFCKWALSRMDTTVSDIHANKMCAVEFDSCKSCNPDKDYVYERWCGSYYIYYLPQDSCRRTQFRICGEKLPPIVDCQDRAMVVSLRPSDYLSFNRGESRLSLAEEKCGMTYTRGDVAVFILYYDEYCGSKATFTNSSVRFSNEVIIQQKRSSSVLLPVDTVIDFSCTIPLSSYRSTVYPEAREVISVQNGSSPTTLDIRLVNVSGSRVQATVKMESESRAIVAVRLCHLRGSVDPTDNTSQVLVDCSQGSCASAAEVLFNTSSERAPSLTFDLPKHWGSPVYYLHCELEVCITAGGSREDCRFSFDKEKNAAWNAVTEMINLIRGPFFMEKIESEAGLSTFGDPTTIYRSKNKEASEPLYLNERTMLLIVVLVLVVVGLLSIVVGFAKSIRSSATRRAATDAPSLPLSPLTSTLSDSGPQILGPPARSHMGLDPRGGIGSHNDCSNHQIMSYI